MCADAFTASSVADVPLLISSTAHYGKFASDIVEATGICGTDASPVLAAACTIKSAEG